MSRFPALPPLPPGFQADEPAPLIACLMRTAQLLPARWAMCWWCRGWRFRSWGAVVRCLTAGCHRAYLVSPGADVSPLPIKVVYCVRCDHSQLAISARVLGCHTCGWEWAPTVAPQSIHALMDEASAARAQRIGVIDATGAPKFTTLETSGHLTPGQRQSDMRKIARGKDPLVDYRKERVRSLVSTRARWEAA